MKVLGFDISSECTGWGLIEDGNLIKHGDFSTAELKTDGVINNRFLFNFEVKINDMIKRMSPTHVAVEGIYSGHKNPKVGILLSMMSGICRARSFFHTRKEVLTIPTWDVNRLFKIPTRTKTDPRKKLVVAGINKKFGINLFNNQHDTADAIAIAWVAYDGLLNHKKLAHV